MVVGGKVVDVLVLDELDELDDVVGVVVVVELGQLSDWIGSPTATFKTTRASPALTLPLPLTSQMCTAQKIAPTPARSVNSASEVVGLLP